MITLAETKNYLRVDHTEDDKLILSLIDTAKRLVQDVGRMDEQALAVNEETTRQAMLYTVSYLYTHCCTTLSTIVGIPKGRVLPLGFGISTRLTGRG